MKPFFLRRVACSTRLFCLLLLLVTAPVASLAQGTAAPEPVATPEEEDAELDPKAPARFGIQLHAPKDLQPFLLRHLDLQRFRRLADLDSSELDRLLLAAPENLRGLLGTQGYFSPSITVQRLPAQPPKTPQQEGNIERPVLGDVEIHVTLGPATEVISANVYLQGDVATAEAAAAQRTTILAERKKVVGEVFSQDEWDRFKSETLRHLTSERYPRGRIVNSLSDVDTANHAANWHLELDSGTPVHIGEVKVLGAERYDPVVVERRVRLAGLTPGVDYSLSKLQDAQQAIAASGYYTSVFAYVDLDPESAAADNTAPVVVQVKEAQPQKVVLGVGGSTNNGARLSLEHSHLRLPWVGWRANSKLQLETNDQLLSSEWSAPIEADGWHWLAGGRLVSQVDDDTTTSGLRLSIGKAQETAQRDRRYFVQYDRARTVNATSALASSDGNEASISINHGWTWRRFDNVPYPNSGYGLGLTLGVGSTLGTERKPFFTTQARWRGYWPLGRLVDDFPKLVKAQSKAAEAPQEKDNTREFGRLAVRLQGSAVLANSSAPIPDTQLFLTGGDTTVRGYGLRDIGVVESDGSVTAGRYLAVASLEWQRPYWIDGVRTDWESVLFVDAGAVANQPTDLTAKFGVGAGVRYNSPVGPLQLDLAYGVDSKKFRIHLNVGFSF